MLILPMTNNETYDYPLFFFQIFEFLTWKFFCNTNVYNTIRDDNQDGMDITNKTTKATYLVASKFHEQNLFASGY